MTATLAQIQRTVDARLRELEPLVEEYRQLRDVAESLRSDGAGKAVIGQSGGTRGGATAAQSRHAVGSSSSGRRSSGNRGRGRRAPRGHNQKAIFELVGQRPGISNREIAEMTGIDRRVVATAISKYKRDGLLAAEGDGVTLVEEASS